MPDTIQTKTRLFHSLPVKLTRDEARKKLRGYWVAMDLVRTADTASEAMIIVAKEREKELIDLLTGSTGTN